MAASSDTEDEDLKLAIALSLQSEAAERVTSPPDLKESKASEISSKAFNIAFPN